MNPFFNPLFLSRILISYLFDIDRVWKASYAELKKYQDKSLRRIVKHAYSVPFYHKKCKKHGVHPHDIRGVKDVEKLPFVTKNDLRENFPDGIVPVGFNKKNSFMMSTSGSTGKPVFVFCDIFSAIKSLEAFVRGLRAYGGSWRKTRIVLIIDLSPGSVEYTFFTQSAMPILKKLVPLENIRYLHIGEKPELLIEKINEFNPEFIGSDPNMLRILAYLKQNGYGRDVKPKYVLSGGSMLDSYTRQYIEKTFDAKVLDYYATTEAGPIAFECLNGSYHINSDFVILEFLDDENQPVEPEKPGHVVVTKLYGGGTPIIRYNGLDDLVIHSRDICSCGINTPLIKHIVGRSTDVIILPNGKMLTPFSLTGIPAKIMEEYGTYKIKQFQIIQHKIDEIEILVVIDDKTRDIEPPVEKILKELKERFQEKIGSDIKIFVSEVPEIQKNERIDHTKVVISKIKKPHTSIP
ncbi:hypothetical protein B6U70_01930 [Euryarchaeota archaeon ex4484_162]|nr:MAG: hypothetical protein B6U70_01930 [Euryarchaeota archaeon ex4484_162]RLF29251.1 MAG: hypothetical protein DRN05_02055 [Thermoplasmata archaeon]RLF33866.1 MAG: hypothetical protein DRN08_05130 [Thermoplasmata archaeon]